MSCPIIYMSTIRYAILFIAAKAHSSIAKMCLVFIAGCEIRNSSNGDIKSHILFLLLKFSFGNYSRNQKIIHLCEKNIYD